MHPQDRPLQAMRWEGQLYVDPMLPFGLRSSPKIFNAVADVLNWHLHQSGIPLIRHYLDDFIIIAPPHSSQCREALATLDRECRSLGVPIADHKRDGSTTYLVFLGIEIDSEAGQLRLPADKLQHLQTLLHDWGDRRACSRKELESLVGLLNHACKVVRSGRSFHHQHQWHQNPWFQLQWNVRSSGLSIVEKELIPIVLAAATWGGAWQGRQVLCHCDNQVVVACLQSRTSKHKGVMQLLCCFVFVEAHFGFYLYPSYVGTKANHLVDDLSRNNLCSFLSKVPSADCYPAPVSSPLLDLLLDPQADWTSPSWHRQFKAIFRTA